MTSAPSSSTCISIVRSCPLLWALPMLSTLLVRRRAGEFWIQCDSCDRWFDGQVGVARPAAAKLPAETLLLLGDLRQRMRSQHQGLDRMRP